MELTGKIIGSDKVPKPRWWILLLFAALSILAGALAIGLPLVASIAYSLFFGILLAAIGILQIVEVITEQRDTKKWWDIGSGILAVLAGGFILLFPWAGIISLTLLIGWFFVLDASLRIWSAAQPENSNKRGWIIATSALSLILGLIILIALPETWFYTLGLLWGVHSIFLGVASGCVAFSLRERNN